MGIIYLAISWRADATISKGSESSSASALALALKLALKVKVNLKVIRSPSLTRMLRKPTKYIFREPTKTRPAEVTATLEAILYNILH